MTIHLRAPLRCRLAQFQSGRLRMRWMNVLAVVPMIVVAASAQQGSLSQPYQPSVPQSSGGGYMGFYGGIPGGGTVEGSMEQGMASMMSAAGNYNLATSAAA